MSNIVKHNPAGTPTSSTDNDTEKQKPRIVDSQVTKVFLKNLKALTNKRISVIVNRGGTRSSKTFSIVQLFVIASFLYKKEQFLVARYAMPALKATVRKDYREVIEMMGLQKSFREYLANGEERFVNLQTGTEINLSSIDRKEKILGAKYKLIHLNEGDEISYHLFTQLDFRLKSGGKIYIDLNPRDATSWIKTKIEDLRAKDSRDVAIIKSSYLSNPFLAKDQVKRIEYQRKHDRALWAVYGKGEWGQIKHTIFQYSTISPQEYDNVIHTHQFYGHDWGDVHPTVLLEIRVYEDKMYIKQLFHKSFTDEKEILNVYREKVNRSCFSWLDHQFQSFKRLLNANGFLAYAARKGQGSVEEGIKFMQWYKIYITSDSIETIRDFKNYKWQEDKEGNIIKKPVKIMDDAPDAARMAMFSMQKRGVVPPGYYPS